MSRAPLAVRQLGRSKERRPPRSVRISGVENSLTGWSLAITDLVAANNRIERHQVAAMTADMTWPPRPDVTLIGDPAYLMPPSAKAPTGPCSTRPLVVVLPERPGRGHPGSRDSHVRTHQTDSSGVTAHPIQASPVAPDALSTMTTMFGGQRAR